MNIQEESESSQETEDWEEVPVPSRRGMVDAVPPMEEEPEEGFLKEEVEEVCALLRKVHLGPPPSHNGLEARMWQEHQRRHSDDDCLITKVVRQSKLTEFFKPKKNN